MFNKQINNNYNTSNLTKANKESRRVGLEINNNLQATSFN